MSLNVMLNIKVLKSRYVDHNLTTIDLGTSQGVSTEFRQKYLEYQTKIEEYKKTIHDCVFDNIRNDSTIAMCIVKWAETLEQIYILNNQQWLISEVANNILRSLKTIGIPDSKSEYVYVALKDFPKYSSRIDHSKISDNTGNRQEQLYKSNARIIKEYIKKISEMFDPDLLLRSDAQDICGMLIDVKEKSIEKVEAKKIPVCELKQKDFEGVKDKFQEKVRYPKTKPAFTLITEAWKRNLEARQKVYDRLVLEGKESLEGVILLTPSLIEDIAEAIDLDTYIWEPFTDRKWRKSMAQWISIVQNSLEWFKHSASRKFKVQDLQGIDRELTREAIGGKKVQMLQLANKLLTKEVYRWLLMGIWWEKTADKRGAEFSKELSPKLSDRSIK